MDRQSNGQSPGCLGSDSTQARSVIAPVPAARKAVTTALRAGSLAHTAFKFPADFLGSYCSKDPVQGHVSAHTHNEAHRHIELGSQAACAEVSPPIPCSVQTPAT